jgi:HlyD family secretion protein
MRLTQGALLVSTLIAGLSYTSEGDHRAAAFVTAPVERGAITKVVKATGAVEAVSTVDVSSQLSGKISEVFVNFNDSVRVGQPLAQLDQEIFAARVSEAKAALKVASATALLQRAAVDRAAAEVANAKAAKRLAEAQSAAAKAKQDEMERDLARKLALERSGSGTERELTQARSQRDATAADYLASIEQMNMKEEVIAIAEAERRMAEANVENALAVVEQKQAALDQARVDVDQTVIRAPMDGTVMKRDVNPGQTVAVSLEAKTLFRIVNDLTEMEVHAKVDEADVGALRTGQAASFTVDAYPERTFAGKVVQIRKSPEIEQNVVTYTAIISAPNPDQLLLPGMTASLRIVVSDTGISLKIPNQALRFRPDGVALGSDKRSGEGAASLADNSATVWALSDDGRPFPIAVQLGMSDEQSTQVIAGPLFQNQRVLVGKIDSTKKSGFFGIRLGF